MLAPYLEVVGHKFTGHNWTHVGILISAVMNFVMVHHVIAVVAVVVANVAPQIVCKLCRGKMYFAVQN
jgi:hypothetical protein